MPELDRASGRRPGLPDVARGIPVVAKVAELADAPDLGSGGKPWGFESPLSHPPRAVENGA